MSQIPACDPVTVEIVRGAIAAAQSEMEALIERTAISAFIREKKDFYSAVFDAEGVMAVGSNVPIFGDVTGPVLARYPAGTMRDGDVYWYNDCYASRGAVSHSNDQVLLAPVFEGGTLRAFVMAWAHFSDIGGSHAGSISPAARSIYEEGIIIPPTRLIRGGEVNEAALAIFHRNSRFPDQSAGDMSALLAAVDLGRRRIEEALGRFGPDRFAGALGILLERTRGLVRAKLMEDFAVGTHHFTDGIDGDGQGSGPLTMRFSMTRTEDDRFIFDATQSDDQAPGPVNLLMNEGVPGMALGLFYLGGDATQVCNAGGPRALDEVRLREGSFVQPVSPAPLGMRGLTMMRMLSALNGLVNVGGGDAPASHSSYVVAMFRGRDDRGGADAPFLLVDGLGVGYGARSDKDGIDAVYFVAQENYPAEFLEQNYPMRLRRYGIAQDSGGPGRFRGGCGIVREYEILCEQAEFSIRIDGVETPPWGYDGGMGGGTGSVTINPGRSDERAVRPLSDGNMVRRGDVVRFVTGGGGGRGHPFDRPADTVAEDVAAGLVSREAAEARYGVILAEDGAPDRAATEAARAARPAVKRFHRKDYVDAL